jgi:formate dehydrogenase subunit delta
MDSENLIRMVNRIAAFFASMPDRDEAVEGVALHIRKFWAPSMRRALLAHVDRVGTDELHPLAAEALGSRRSMLV